MARSVLLFGLKFLLVAIVLLQQATGSQAYDEKEKLAYVEDILTQMNDRFECKLPSIPEVVEMRKFLDDFESAHGIDGEIFNSDMKIARKTLLDQWVEFEQQMESTVVIRPAIRRMFICRVEAYQRAKYGDSVCARFKDTNNKKVTGHVFIRNPIIRYVTHIETNEVIERPEGDGDVEVEVDGPTEGKEEAIVLKEEEEEEVTETVGQAAGDDPSGEQIQPPVTTSNEDNADEKPIVVDKDDEEQQPKEEIVYKSKDDKLQPGDHYLDEDGLPHVFLGHFTLESQSEDGKSKKLRFKIDQNLNYDPLDQIPVPASTDEGVEENKEQPVETPIDSTTTTTTTTTTTPEPEPETEIITTPEPTTTTTTTTPEPLCDEFGAPYVLIEDDDEDLTRVVTLPKKDWEFDQVFGYFKWPDEGPEKEPLQLDVSIRFKWEDFTLDPIAYDQFVDQLDKPKEEPKINFGAARRKKQEFFENLQREQNYGNKFSWINSMDPAPGYVQSQTLTMPPPPQDRWIKMLNNKVCKLGVNSSEIKRRGKGGIKAVKNWWKGDGKSSAKQQEQFDQWQ